jgi:hypothetical protein
MRLHGVVRINTDFTFTIPNTPTNPGRTLLLCLQPQQYEHKH